MASVRTSIPVVALVGNPNAGKTSVFNALTGASQHVGNYPGVTVERVSATMNVGDLRVEMVDVPGLYSVMPISEDERVATEVLYGREPGVNRPDLLVCVIDATNLERNLLLFSQVAELGTPVVVALTMVDMLTRQGQTVDVDRLRQELGVPVVPIVAHKKQGVNELRQAIRDGLDSGLRPEVDVRLPEDVETEVTSLRHRLARNGFDVATTEIRQALLLQRGALQERLHEMPEIAMAFGEARQRLEDRGFLEAGEVTARRYEWAANVAKAAIASRPTAPKISTARKLDRILTHRVYGLLVFVGVMYLVFQSIYTFAAPFMEWIEMGIGALGERVGPLLEQSPVLESLVVDGLIGGVGAMVVFLPQIIILFFWIAVLEGTGYLARAAFLMDRLLGWCGLNGRAFIPLLSSFACAIPGIMAARVMPDARSRLATILVAPLMSCSARLPVYLLLIGTFVAPTYGPIWAGVALFGMHLIGLVVAIPMVYLLNKGILKGKRLPFHLELPPYQWPKWRDVGLTVYFRAGAFVKTAGTIIVALSMVIWALTYFPRSEATITALEQEYVAQNVGDNDEEAMDHFVRGRLLEQSFLGRFGRTIEPVFEPAGFDWRLSTAIIAAFPAREVIVPSLGILFSLGDDIDYESTDLRTALQRATWPDGRKLLTPYVAFGLMIFFALCCQCMATLATVRRETGTWRWPIIMFSVMSLLAYTAAVIVNQIGLRLAG
ncbi:MAG: ferrous iron transport protein B [Fimbriimonadaceae bacterium]